MKTRNYFIIFFTLLLIIVGCRKDEIVVDIEDEILPDTENVTFQFLITNESGEAIENASVEINSTVYNSDENGVVVTQPQKISSLGTRSEINATGYETLVKLVNGIENEVSSERIILFKSETSIISTGQSGAIDGGGRLSLPSTLTRADGSTYSGEVIVKNKYLNPDDKDFLQSAPGNLLALNANDAYRQLASFGMYMIELYDAEGNELNIPEGSSATIEFPIADKHKSDIESTIPLWYFDEDQGLWIEEGEAIIQDDKMVAEVNHFTWWNCDLPYEIVPVCLIFLDVDGDPLPGLEIRFSVNGVDFGIAFTNVNGALAAKIPVGQLIDLKFYLFDEEIGSQTIGPFGITIRKETIFTDLDPIKIVGVAFNCSSDPVSNGYGYFFNSSGIRMIAMRSDGSFEYIAPGIDHQLVIVDKDSDRIKVLEVLAADQNVDLDLGTIEVCEEEISTKISGNVLVDTDQDNIGDSPVSGTWVVVTNNADSNAFSVYPDDNGYYEFEALPGVEYSMAVSIPAIYAHIASGDKTPDGDHHDEEYKLNNPLIKAIALQDEHDSDNDFGLIPGGEGTVSGSVLVDTDDDGMGDAPLEWFEVMYDGPGLFGYHGTITDMYGNYSFTERAGFLFLSSFDVLSYIPIIDWDITPDPDGDDSIWGNNLGMEVVLQDGEVDADNLFVLDNTNERTILCRVMEDTNMDGNGDTALEGIGVHIVSRISGNTVISEDTDRFGIVRYKLQFSHDNELTLSLPNNSQYEIIDIIDTSPDGDPLIIGGDMTKMEIDVMMGEWDAGNIFVVRKI
ncbi:MAG: carboxypeptidase-like regulatory domain-containing protein [Bacteroidota bacterium]